MNETAVLIHSPLVGPLTWAPVSRELRERGIDTLVPVLAEKKGSEAPYWAQHASAVARRLEPIVRDRALMLVAHSGAGSLLPAIAAFSPHPVAGYLFVDAGLPHPGRSRLEDIEAGAPDFGAELRRELEAGGSFPQWTDEDLRQVIPDEGLRQAVLAELHPRDLAFFEEPIPFFAGWPDAPCGYIKLSEAYARPADQAQQNGWAYGQLDGGHFHMLVDPKSVAEALLELMARMREQRVDLSESL